MEFYKKEIESPTFTLYPIGDFHYGSEQCDVDFIKRVIKEIQHNPNAKWVGMGDFIENAIPGSPGDIHSQTVPPGQRQMDDICELLLPIADKGLFLIAGNHEARSRRNTGIIPEQYISLKLNIPYKGFSCLARFSLFQSTSQQYRSCIAYFHHNCGGGYTRGGKVNKAEQLRLLVPTADAIFAGHFHITSRVAFTWFEAGMGQVIERVGYDYITGSALTWNKSYAEEKAKQAAVREFIRVTFSVKAIHQRWCIDQTYSIIKPEDILGV